MKQLSVLLYICLFKPIGLYLYVAKQTLEWWFGKLKNGTSCYLKFARFGHETQYNRMGDGSFQQGDRG